MSDGKRATRRQVVRAGAAAAVASVAGCTGSDGRESGGGADGLVNLARKYLGGGESESPPVFAEGDPGRNSYPRNPESAEAELLGSKGIEDAFERLYTEYRERNGAEELYPNASLSSGARKHSYDMATNGYVGPDGPNGEDPVEKYGPLQVSCAAVESLVHRTGVTVVDETGARTGVADADVAADVFSAFREDDDASTTLLLPKSEAAAAGVGVYLAPRDTDGSREVVDVYLTVDVCRGFDANKQTEY